jgi:hypothetical protein
MNVLVTHTTVTCKLSVATLRGLTHASVQTSTPIIPRMGKPVEIVKVWRLSDNLNVSYFILRPIII